MESEGEKTIEPVQKTKAFSFFALSHTSTMRLLRDFGLLRQPWERSDNKALGILGGKERTYRNIAEHCLVVGMVEDVMLERLVERGFLSNEQRIRGTKAAIMHDMLKRKNLEIQYGIKIGDEKEYINPVLRGRINKTLLEDYRLTDQDREIYSLSLLSGDGVLALNPDEIDINRDPEGLIGWTIFLSDYMVAHSSLVDPQMRMEEAIGRGTYNDEFIWWYKKLYGEESLNDLKDVGEVARKVYEKTKIMLDRAESHLRPLLGIDTQINLVNFVRGQIEKRYTKT